MRSLALGLVSFFGIAIVGCGSSPEMTVDMQVTMPMDLAPFNSTCGQPGDTGNSLGIGQFCTNSNTCTPGLLCSAIENGTPNVPLTYFCTTTCPMSMAGTQGSCGSDTTCSCQSGTCACVPNKCLTTGLDS